MSTFTVIRSEMHEQIKSDNLKGDLEVDGWSLKEMGYEGA